MRQQELALIQKDIFQFYSEYYQEIPADIQQDHSGGFEVRHSEMG